MTYGLSSAWKLDRRFFLAASLVVGFLVLFSAATMAFAQNGPAAASPPSTEVAQSGIRAQPGQVNASTGALRSSVYGDFARALDAEPFRVWAGPVVVAMAILVGALLLLVFSPPGLRNAGLILLAVSALLRLLISPSFLAVDGDDVTFAAHVLDLNGELSDTTHNSTSAVALWRLFCLIGGHSIHSIFLTSQFFATLIPVLVLQFAWQWGGDQRLARWAGGLALFYPPLIAFGASNCLELPAAALFGFALTLGLWGTRRSLPITAVTALISGMLIAFVCSMKTEFVVFLLVLVAVGIGHPDKITRLRRGQWMMGALLVALAGLWGETLFSFFQLVFFEGNRMQSDRLDEYFLFGVLRSNPPGAPLIWLFLWDLFRPKRVGHRPLQAWVLLFVLLYASTMHLRGMNHMRYALDSMFPLLTVLAPIIMDWWDGRGKLWARGILAAVLIGQMVFVCFWIGQRRARSHDFFGDLVVQSSVVVQGYDPFIPPQQRDLEEISSRNFEARTLVVYAHHELDRSPALTLKVVGGFDLTPVGSFWPSSCGPSIEAERARLRTAFANLCYIALPAVHRNSTAVKFQSLDQFEQDRSWLDGITTSPWLQRARRDLDARKEALDAMSDPARCTQQIDAMRRRLATYDRILVFRDTVSARDYNSVFNFAETIEIALGAMETASTESDGSLGWHEVLRVPDPVDGAGRPPVWTRDSGM